IRVRAPGLRTMTYRLLHEALALASDRYPDRDFMLAGGEHWSFERLDELSNAFARHLAGRGVKPGQRVAVMTTNRPEFLVAVYAISKLGAASVLLSSSWKEIEV